MLYKITYSVNYGYDDKTLIGRQKWDIWDTHYRVGYCHFHPTNNFRENKYYLCNLKYREI